MAKEELIYSTGDEKVKRFFNKLSESMGVYICSYDYYGRIINDFTGNNAERDLLDRYIGADLRHEMFERLTLDSIEDQIVENTASPFIKLAATALKFEGQCKEVWFIAGVLCDDADEQPFDLSVFEKKTSYAKFIHAIDAMREIGKYRVSMELTLASFEEQSRKSLFSANEMAESLKRVETLTQILKYLDSDNSIEVIMKDFLSISATYLGISRADILKTKGDPEYSMDIVSSFLASGEVSPYDRSTDILKFEFLEGKKPIILSTGASALNRFNDEHQRFSANAIVAMPIVIGHKVDMYAVFFETKKERYWKIEELQFLSDATRVLQNIIEKRIQKNSLAGSYASMEQILENVGCAIVVNDTGNKEILFENKQMKNIFPAEKISVELKEILWEKKYAEREEIEYYDNAKGKWYEIHHSNISWIDGRPVALYAIYDVTDKKNYQRKIEQQAYTDFLTGLHNRLCCERDLARIIDEAKKYGETAALLYMDLDDFKHINDELGHQYGDLLLKNISQGIQSIKGIEENCYRMGGDEFVVIVTPRSYRFFSEILDNIRIVFSKPWYLKDGERHCTMSMGIVTFPDEGDNVDELIKKADMAMYRAKKTGKNKVEKFKEI